MPPLQAFELPHSHQTPFPMQDKQCPTRVSALAKAMNARRITTGIVSIRITITPSTATGRRRRSRKSTSIYRGLKSSAGQQEGSDRNIIYSYMLSMDTSTNLQRPNHLLTQMDIPVPPLPPNQKIGSRDSKHYQQQNPPLTMLTSASLLTSRPFWLIEDLQTHKARDASC